MFESRENLLDEIISQANSNAVFYHNILKPTIEDYGDTADEAEWEAAAQVAVGCYVKDNFFVELGQAGKIAQNLFTKEDIEYIADAFMNYYEEEIEEARAESIERHKAKMKELFGE